MKSELLSSEILIWIYFIFHLGSLGVDWNRAEIRQRLAISLGRLSGTSEKRTFLELWRYWTNVQKRQGNLCVPNQIFADPWRITWERSRILFSYISSPIQISFDGNRNGFSIPRGRFQNLQYLLCQPFQSPKGTSSK